MTKRCYPFQDFTYQRLKYHVTEELMKKTMQNYCHKDRNYFEQPKYHPQFPAMKPEVVIEPTRTQPRYKQLYITQQGQLCNTCPDNSIPMEALLYCISCRVQLAETYSIKCDFCEKRTCDSCLQLCSRCLKHFCRLCSVNSYDQQVVTTICLTCLS